MKDTFYCFWCWQYVPLSKGYRVVPPKKRKQCTPCYLKTKEASHAVRHRAAAHAQQDR